MVERESLSEGGWCDSGAVEGVWQRCTVYRGREGKEVNELLLSLPEPESLPSVSAWALRFLLRLRRNQMPTIISSGTFYRYNSQ